MAVNASIFTAWSAIIAALGVLVGVSGVFSQRSASAKNLRATLYLALLERFDSASMRAARRMTAAVLTMQMDKSNRSIGDTRGVDERVMDFFDDMGSFLKAKYIDKELTRLVLGYYAMWWWEASKDYVKHQRRSRGDKTLFSEFEYLATKVGRKGWKNNADEGLKRFLKDEQELPIDFVPTTGSSSRKF